MHLLRAIVYMPEFRLVWLVVLFVTWIFGIVYCERVGDELELNVWWPRLLSVFLPVFAPLWFWFWRRRFRSKRGLGRDKTVKR